MTLRKFLLCTAAVGALFSTSLLQAQAEKKGKGQGGAQMVEQLISRIDEAVGGLTADQKTKIQGIYAKSAAGLRDASPEERAGKMRETRDQVRAVLTPEQQTKFDAMPAPGRGQGGGQGKKKKDQ